MTRTMLAATLALALTGAYAPGAGAQGAATPGTGAPATPAVRTYEADLTGNDGRPIGRIAIRDGANALVMRLTVQAGGLAPGWHGIHFHAVGDCSDPAKFERSKAHVNHDNAKHGLLNAEGPDEGDLANVYANADGSVNAEVTSDTQLTGEGGLRDSDGSALIVHANEDDHQTQPIGNAGARVACALIK